MEIVATRKGAGSTTKILLRICECTAPLSLKYNRF